MGLEAHTAVGRRRNEARELGRTAAVDERRPPMTTTIDGANGAGVLRPEWLIERDGTPYILYAGLLALAHARGLKRITTTLVQVPAAANGHVALAAAEVETEQGVFTGIGEAAPGNVPRHLATALPRVAETRAKAQALGDAVNVGLTAFEARAPDAVDALDGDRVPDAPALGARPELVRAAASTEGPDRAPHPGHTVSTWERPALADRVLLGDQPYSRAQIVAGLRRRMRQARVAGLAVPEPVPAEDGPLDDLARYVQALRRRLEAHAPDAPD
jgi:hypothetical protein